MHVPGLLGVNYTVLGRISYEQTKRFLSLFLSRSGSPGGEHIAKQQQAPLKLP